METGNVREAEARDEREGTTLVLGGTGKTGRRVAARLEARGLPVRVGSRSGQPPFDWENLDTWAPALEGVESVYVSYYPDIAIPGAPEAVRSFAELAVQSGVRRLVLLSGRGEEDALPKRRTTDWETVRKGVRATLRAWIWVVYERRNGPKAPLMGPAGLRGRRVRGFSDSFGMEFSEVASYLCT